VIEMKTRWTGVLGVALACSLCAGPSRAQEQAAPAPAADAAPAPGPAAAAKPPSLFKRVDRGGISDQPTVITSARIEFDYKEMVAVFDEKVRVENPEFLMLADRVLVFLEGTNDIKQILAIGHVSVTNGLRSAACDKAVYTRAAEQLVLTGRARLLRGADSVSGDRIDIWLNDERMEVTPGTVVFTPGTAKNKEPVKPEQP
jgi:lipopolysaccharide transport protein LptA